MKKQLQSNLFDFLEEIKEQEPTTLTYTVPTMELSELLTKMQDLIKKDVMKQTDKYFRLSLSYQPHIVKTDYCDNYMVIALAWSDSAVYNEVFENGGNKMSTEEYLNLCDSLGAYTKVAWQNYHDDKTITPSKIMEKFKIKEHIRPISFATGSKEDCEDALKILIEWNTHHIKPLSELHANTEYNFIRIHRRKGEIESTRCMNGECIGGILTRENAF